LKQGKAIFQRIIAPQPVDREPQLLANLLGTIKTWVGELVSLVSATQKSNEGTIQNLHQAATISDRLQLTARNLRAVQTPLLVDSGAMLNEIRRLVNQPGSSDQVILDLFSNLFGQENWRERGLIVSPSPTASSHGKRQNIATTSSSDVDEAIIGNGSPVYIKSTENTSQQLVETKIQDEIISAINVLREVDDILSKLSIFWSNTEVILDALSKKGQHIETFVSYTHNPNLVARFRDRLNEYRFVPSNHLSPPSLDLLHVSASLLLSRRFWVRVNTMCNAFLMEMQDTKSTSTSSKNIHRKATPPEEVSPQSSYF
jgi:hypothetical protein